jgi:hypothetical protein
MVTSQSLRQPAVDDGKLFNRSFSRPMSGAK